MSVIFITNVYWNFLHYLQFILHIFIWVILVLLRDANNLVSTSAISGKQQNTTGGSCISSTSFEKKAHGFDEIQDNMK